MVKRREIQFQVGSTKLQLSTEVRRIFRICDFVDHLEWLVLLHIVERWANYRKQSAAVSIKELKEQGAILAEDARQAPR